tara:strand:- start:476 stop:859 length:384 start_codon:yes stop_codon:yes gene_type:complete
MKKVQLLCAYVSLSLAISVSSFAQSKDNSNTVDVNITTVVISDNANTGASNSSAILELNSATRGFLMPRMTNEQRIAIKQPTDGLQVFVINYDTENDVGTIMFYQDSKWRALSGLSEIPQPESANQE